MDYYYNILITGCSSGLGEALFNEVWQHDHLNPFGHYRTEDGDPHALIGDITDSDFPEKLDNHIRENKIDCFINNAGVYEGDIIDTNLGSQIRMLQVVYKYFLENQKGRIININSIAGIYPSANESVYCASKFGLKGFSKSIQLEAVSTGIEITDVYLGGVQTRMTEDRNNYDQLMRVEDVAYQIIDLVNTKSYYVNEVTLRRRNNFNSNHIMYD
ncbi:FabG-like 3-oxoacyl-(acyl-carrier-protein) reductase [Prochlorococcus phage P-TIM68]|uniref:Short-chain dehydrogenase n=1 Tax=Prochlorococcus phage P-TIM68 TaxID=1542477 RepID=A0A0K0KVL6_9CAUD|nr:FabG-like 3-oxoacyl-(acyl-carrier-protein) reductase [Prochlorococcus phage P-TIM68]AIR93525.1 hypothetical protein [Prochlorococcus phage P-TIM68]|tara:strand:- start:24 stop:668 length:645 start_codon:yes stop_codon:yes gene_type:complete